MSEYIYIVSCSHGGPDYIHKATVIDVGLGTVPRYEMTITELENGDIDVDKCILSIESLQSNKTHSLYGNSALSFWEDFSRHAEAQNGDEIGEDMRGFVDQANWQRRAEGGEW